MEPNPYQSPLAPRETPPDVCLREQRQALTAIVRSFLADEIKAFEFDEQIQEFHSSPDSAVRFVAETVWYHYDDCRDHLVALSKPEWDYFQRLLLLLESDRGVESQSTRRWSWSQAVAAAALLGFVWAAIQAGWGGHLLFIAAPFGLVSIAISKHRAAKVAARPFSPILYPFATFRDLASAYDAVSFKKTRCPRHVSQRRVRSPASLALIQLQTYISWLFLSPVPLLLQVFPETERDAYVAAR